MMGQKRVLRSLAILAVIAATTQRSMGDRPTPIWDPPAITVFPDHDVVAHDPSQITQFIEDGRKLFIARFNKLDGAGRPAATGDSKPTPRALQTVSFSRTSGPDALSCSACHTQPVIGGSGDMPANVFIGAHFADVPTTDLRPEVTNERNTTSILGAGAIETVAREMTVELQQQRDNAIREARSTLRDITVQLLAKGVRLGSIVARADGTIDTSHLEGVDNDLVVRPFGSKGIAVSLREFTIGALNQHHGIQAVERFGWARTGLVDFDGDGVEVEFTIGQMSALVVFQASLSPLLRAQPRNATEAIRWKRGERLFQAAGCATCHVPSLALNSATFREPNPFNRPGTLNIDDVDAEIIIPLASSAIESGVQRLPNGSYRVWAYSDLRRHVICDDKEPFFCNERRKQDNIPTDQFMTPKLWDLAASAPYGHRGDCGSVSEAILHHGGEATSSRRSFEKLPVQDKVQLIEFLLSLGATSLSGVPH